MQLEKPVILCVVLPNTGTFYLSSSWAFYQLQAKHQKLRYSGFSISTKSASFSEWTAWISIGAHLEQAIPNTLGYNSYSDSDFLFLASINWCITKFIQFRVTQTLYSENRLKYTIAIKGNKSKQEHFNMNI